MALARKCDRCEIMYEHYPIGNQPGEFNGLRLVRTTASGMIDYEKDVLDLCPTCMGLLKKYLNECTWGDNCD